MEDPRVLGESFKDNLKSYWRYRVGNYRILADINDYEIKIIIFNIDIVKIFMSKSMGLLPVLYDESPLILF